MAGVHGLKAVAYVSDEISVKRILFPTACPPLRPIITGSARYCRGAGNCP
jgi:hypothetical protein